MNKPKPISPLFNINNEDELIFAENHIQSILRSKIDINLTSKRKNKLRDLTCAFAGFNNGYQQLKTYWEDSLDQNTILYSILSNSITNHSNTVIIVSNENETSVNIKVNKYNQIERLLNKTDRIKLFQELEVINNKSKIFYLYFNNEYHEIEFDIIPAHNNLPILTFKIKNLNNKIKSIDDIGLNNLELVKKSLDKKSGLILISGTINNGKSTTLSAISEYVKLNNYNNKINYIDEIKTLEDIKNIRKKIDNKELVVATIHSSSGFGAIKRIESISENLYSFNSDILCVISQVLIPKKCDMCKGHGCIHCFFKGSNKFALLSDVKLGKDLFNYSNQDYLYKDAIKKHSKGILLEKEVIRTFGKFIDLNALK